MITYVASREEKLQELYATYLNVIKPLLAEIEANYEKSPEPLFNEIRAFNDHIARCYISGISQEEINSQLEKAGRHIHRLILDCYKYLNVYYKQQVDQFEKQTINIDLTSIDNGDFYIEYRKLKESSIQAVKEAKLKEYNENGSVEFSYFEKSYNKYVELYDFIEDNYVKIRWARAKYYKSKIKTVIVSIISLIAGAVVKWAFPLIIQYLQNK